MTRHRDEPQHNQSTENRPPPRRRRGKFWLLGLLVIVIAGVWFAPTIVMKTGLRNRLVSIAVPDFQGKIDIGGGSAGWLSAIQLRDVAIWDDKNQPVARIPLITSDKPLFQFLSQQRNLGVFQLHNPEIQLVLTEDSSNVEQLLKPFLTTEESPPTTGDDGASVGVGLNVIDGRLLIDDTVTNQSCIVENLNLELSLPDAAPAPLSLHLTADAQQGAERGKLSINFEWQMPPAISEEDLGDGQLQLVSEGFPLIAIQPLLRRAESDLIVNGQLVADVGMRWRRGQQGPEVTGKGSVSIHEPRVAMPSVLGTDQLDMRRLTITMDLASGDDVIQLNALEIRSDHGDLELSATAGLRELLTGDNIMETLLNWQSSHSYSLRGNIDIAGLAEQLPATLRLKEGTQFLQGQVRLNLNSRMELGRRLIQGSLQTDRIEAIAGGRQFSWDQPLHLTIDGASSADGVFVRDLSCQSDFLKVSANGTLAEGSLTAKCNLQELAQQVGRFSDLGDLQLTGTLTAEGGWKQSDDGLCDGKLTAVVKQFVVASSSVSPIREDELQVVINSRGVLSSSGLQRLESFQLKLTSGEDHLNAQLTSAVEQPNADSSWPMTCTVAGHTESWLARLGPWVTLGEWAVVAGIEANLTGTLHVSEIVVDPCQVRLTNVNARSEGWLIREPQVVLQGAFAWKADGNRLVAPEWTLSSSAIAARGTDASLSLDDVESTATGRIAFRGDLNRLGSWQYSPEPPTVQLIGQFSGQAQLATAEGAVRFQGNADVTDFSYQQREAPVRGAGPSRWTNVWTEPKLQLTTQGEYEPGKDQLRFSQLNAKGDGIAIDVTGKLNEMTSGIVADVKGQVVYDLAKLTNKMRDTLGPDIQITGQRKSTFSVQGPISSATVSVGGSPVAAGQLAVAAVPGTYVSSKLAAEASFGWDSLTAYGITLGPQEISTQLQQGVLQFSPLSTSVAQGSVSVTPRIELNANPMSLVIDEGVIADNIQITPEMFATWFRYIAPILADTATAQGRISIELQGARVPLYEPTKSTVAGTIRIDGARVQPGPMAQQLLGTVTEVARLIKRTSPDLDFLTAGKDWLEIEPQNIEFQMQQGRVFHRNLELKSGNITLRTRGWVDTDQSIGLMAEIPILDDWVAKHRLLATMKGQSIQIPIQGTLSRPQVDRRAIAQLSKKLIGNTAQKLLQDELQKGLKKLLGPR